VSIAIAQRRQAINSQTDYVVCPTVAPWLARIRYENCQSAVKQAIAGGEVYGITAAKVSFESPRFELQKIYGGLSCGGPHRPGLVSPPPKQQQPVTRGIILGA